MIPIWNNIKNYTKMGIISALNDKTYQKIKLGVLNYQAQTYRTINRGCRNFKKGTIVLDVFLQ